MKFLNILLFAMCFYNISAQLNEFVIMSYFSEADPDNNNVNILPPWRDPSKQQQDFFSELKNKYNFNTIYFASTYQFWLPGKGDFYKMAKDVGLKSILYIDPLSSYFPPFNQDNAQKYLNKYSDFQYDILGYNIIDEPLSIECSSSIKDNLNIDSIPKYSQIIKAHDENLLRYANLLPYPYSDDQCYREKYIQNYIDKSTPNILSFDHYPIYNKDLNFFISLYDFALKSVENSLPFIYVLTPYQKRSDFNNKYQPEDKTISAKKKAEFNYVIYASLAYGAKGIGYWPGLQWVINNGSYVFSLKYDDDVLSYLNELHKKLISNSDILLSLNFVSAYHKSTISTIKNDDGDSIGEEHIHDFSHWSEFKKDKYVQQIFNLDRPISSNSDNIMISFMRNNSGQIYFWVFNKDMDQPIEVFLNVKEPIVDVLNNCRLLPLSDLSGCQISLSEGEAKLFTTSSTSSPINYNCNGVSLNNFYPLITGNKIAVGDSNNVIFDKDAVASFIGDQIQIKQMHAKAGSTVRFKAYKESNTVSSSLRSKVFYSDEVQENSIAETQQVEYKQDYQIYPNPVIDEFTLLTQFTNEKEADLIMYNYLGLIVKRMKITSSEVVLSLDKYAAGVYIILLIKDNKRSYFKIIKI